MGSFSLFLTFRIDSDDIRLCLRSIGDNNSFLRGTRDPIDRVIQYLEHFFDPEKYESEFSLSISYGDEGARLSHDHNRQYHYVHQSLTLWREITHDMFRLWVFAEEDLMDKDNKYRLTNTGQVKKLISGSYSLIGIESSSGCSKDWKSNAFSS